jgi:hypothetical protein
VVLTGKWPEESPEPLWPRRLRIRDGWDDLPEEERERILVEFNRRYGKPGCVGPLSPEARAKLEGLVIMSCGGEASFGEDDG